MKRKDSGKTARSGPPRARTSTDYADPYQKVRRPRPAGDGPAYRPRPRAGLDEGAPYPRPRPPARGEAGEAVPGRERGSREGGFTVRLDPDVARVFRGDASVNKALRLVLQLMQVVQGPSRSFGPRHERPAPERPRRGYQGSSESRGFTRKPRFEEDDEQ